MDLSHDIRYAHVLKDGQDAFRDASRKKGRKPITRPSRWDLINNQLKHQNDGGSDDVESQINIISHKFPPSVAPLLGLTKTYIGELLLEINHRGSYLLLRTIAPPIKMMEIISAVEDEKGGCESIILHNMDKNRNWRKILPEGRGTRSRRGTRQPEGQVFIVKEPFYNAAGGTGVCVDHVSDIIFLDPDDSRVPLGWRSRVKQLDKTSMNWKEEGNALFRRNEFHEAIECYTKGLRINSDDMALIKNLRLNRSQALISVGFHERALEDAEYVLDTIDSMDEKALFRAAKALYLARRFEACKARLTTLVRNYPDNKDAKSNLLNVYKRLEEGRTGNYDFSEMRKLTESVEKGPVKLDYADFVGPVRVQHTKDSGRGLFTTRDVKFGELLLCSKAFQVCYPQTDGLSLVVDLMTGEMKMSCASQLITAIIQKLYNNPSTSGELLELCSGTYERVNERYIDGRPVVDTFLVHEVRKFNGFGCNLISTTSDSIAMIGADPDDEGVRVDNTGSGIWIMPSYINHACWGPGSVYRTFIGDMMVVRATMDMKEGEQITFGYISHDGNIASRQKTIESWGFTCNCCLCIFENQETVAVRNSRETLLNKIFNFKSIFAQPTAKSLTSALPKIVRLIKSLEATYKKPPTEQPRYALVKGLKLLTKIYVGLRRYSEVIDTAQRIVKAQGYEIEEFPDQGRVVFRRYGQVPDYASLPDVFVQISATYNMCGNDLMGKAYQKVATDFYEVVFGERESFSEVYGEIFGEVGVKPVG